MATTSRVEFPGRCRPKARAGQIPNFTGIDSPYEVPEAAELVLDTTIHSAEQLAEAVVSTLRDEP